MNRRDLLRTTKILIALSHALIPLWLAQSIVTDTELAAALPPPVQFVLRWFFVVSIGMLTGEAMVLQKYPDRLGPLLALLFTVPALALANWFLFFESPWALLAELGTFYLTSFTLLSVGLCVYRFAYQRTIGGWEWIPVSVAMLILFTCTLGSLWAFWRTLWNSGVLSGRLAPWTLAVSTLVAAIYEFRLVLKYHPGPSMASSKSGAGAEGIDS